MPRGRPPGREHAEAPRHPVQGAPTATPPPSRIGVISTVATGADGAEYLRLLQQRILAAYAEARDFAERSYRRGYAAGHDAGWLACIAELKRAQQDTYRLIAGSAPLWSAHWKTLRKAARS